MNKIIFKCIGKIRGKARPRFYGTSKLNSTKVNVRAYKSSNDRIYENEIREAYRGYGGVKFSDDAYIKMNLDMYFKIPKSYSKKRRQQCLVGKERPAKKPDV